LILHPQYTGRPSRVPLLQEMVDHMRAKPGVWIASGREIARHVTSEAAGAGTDGRPLPDAPPASPGRGAKGKARRARARR
ncbi:MAG TPA: hypothetical protein VIG69_07880, partial [Candidatus Methylomirabilis sp.]